MESRNPDCVWFLDFLSKSKKLSAKMKHEKGAATLLRLARPSTFAARVWQASALFATQLVGVLTWQATGVVNHFRRRIVCCLVCFLDSHIGDIGDIGYMDCFQQISAGFILISPCREVLSLPLRVVVLCVKNRSFLQQCFCDLAVLPGLQDVGGITRSSPRFCGPGHCKAGLSPSVGNRRFTFFCSSPQVFHGSSS